MERGLEIPKFVIDLSKPPEARYAHIVPHFQAQIDNCDLSGLFHGLLRDLTGPKIGKCLSALARLSMRRLYMAEESAELVGISKATGIPMHVLVGFNVILDLLLGCTSGGVRTISPGISSPNLQTQMLHFRTLDWGMDQLRKIIVELDFVRSDGGPVIATTVTYLGYVGVLTGVRKGLSMSLNFRPYHARNSWRQRASFRWQQAMVILGLRQSISSVLRGFLLGPAQSNQEGVAKRSSRLVVNEKDVEEVQDDYIQAILSTQATSPSTAAYLILCRPDKVFIIEKDHRQASIRQSDTFLTAYNHDASDEVQLQQRERQEAASETELEESQQLQEAVSEIEVDQSEQRQEATSDIESQNTSDDSCEEDAIGMTTILSYSFDRKTCLDEMWEDQVRACQQLHQRQDKVVTLDDVKLFLKDEDISNDETHYAVIMDPKAGTILWRRAYEADESSESDESTEFDEANN
ncbi:hypothetical protein G7Z17_g1238 [Cylindrodendrum hubeiense]|uniref:ceramidase n=1 Tax=Cylindrodendrum hubeiense TaxID=595255 RepID=A0A9P5HJT4_9HYPO|nr:hypothetical protein G7Z17_g1238 [Cylindrodendrum hubeiense]